MSNVISNSMHMLLKHELNITVAYINKTAAKSTM